jgi:hypothetical protein
MATEHPITDSNPQEIIGDLAEAVHRIDHRTALIETELRRMLAAFSNGGIRGFRAAAKEGSHD